MKKAFKRIWRQGWLNFRRNSYLSFGTTGVMALVLLLFAGLMVLNFVSGQIVQGLQDKVDVSVYFNNNASEDQILAVKQDLANQSEVAQITYVSQDQALADFKAKHAGDALIQESLAELSNNPLEASLSVKAKDSSQYATIVNFLEGDKYRSLIDKINFYENENVINRVESISHSIRNYGLLATLILAVIAVLVTFNTIRLTIYNQKQEIEIMRLVGGSAWHVRAPFLVEGSLYGIFAAVIATVVFYPAIWFASSKVSTLMPGVSLISYFGKNSVEFTLILLVSGILLGIVSSFIAIRRFLHI